MSKIPWRKPHFTKTQLRQILRYNSKTGDWFWLCDRCYRALTGQKAGCFNKTDGRYYLKINSIRYSASRLAWFYMKGTWPKKDVEHKDGDKTNNRWNNFRLASRTENQGNSKPRTSLKVVTKVRTGKYTAQIQKHGRKIHLGTFVAASEAHQAYVKAAQRLYGEFARTA